MNTQEIGNLIKKRRQSLNVNQQELSDLAGIGINTLVAIERGQGNPKLETLQSVLDTLGLQIDIRFKRADNFHDILLPNVTNIVNFIMYTL